MAVTFINNALGATNSTTSFSITIPATQAGDIMILEFAHRGTGNGTIGGTSVTTDGLTWTLKHSQLFGSSLFSGKTYWTRATGNHDTRTVTGSSLTNSCAAVLTIYRGAKSSGDPLADATIVGEQNASGNETQAQITTATAGAWVVLVVVNSPDLAIATQACTSPGALTERAERLSTGGTDSSIAHASAEKSNAGGTGALTWTQTDAASGSWAYAIEPNLSNPISVLPGLGQAVFAGFAAVVAVTANVNVTPGVGAASFAGFAPTVAVTNHQTVSPGTGEILVAGFAPVITIGTNVEPGLGELILAGFSPIVTATDHQNVTPGLGEIALTGFAPSVVVTDHREVLPGLGEMTLTGFAPSVVATENRVVFPGVGEITFTGFAPTVVGGEGGAVVVEPFTGEMILQEFAPQVVTRHVAVWGWKGEKPNPYNFRLRR